MARSAATALSLTVCALIGACTSTEQALDPGAIASQKDVAVTPGQAASSAKPSAAAVAAAVANVRIEIAPLVGPTAEAAAPLSERFAARASERGLKLAGGADGAATHVLKGYFSAIAEGRETTVIYVWDVLDPAGNRLHRLQGQEKTPAKGDGWAGVPPATMQAIADQTIDQLIAWLAARPS